MEDSLNYPNFLRNYSNENTVLSMSGGTRVLRVDKLIFMKIKILGKIHYQIKSEASDRNQKFAYLKHILQRTN